MSLSTTTTSCGARAPVVGVGPNPADQHDGPPSAVEPAGARVGGGLQLAALQPVLRLLDFGRGDSLSVSEIGVIITTDADEDVAACLCAVSGATVDTQRWLVSGFGRCFYSTSLTLDGVSILIHSHAGRDIFVDQLAATAERLAAGETLAEVRAKPLRRVP